MLDALCSHDETAPGHLCVQGAGDRWFAIAPADHEFRARTFERTEVQAPMTSGIRHEGVKDSGSFEVRFPDDRPPRYFYWDDVASRRVRPDMLTTQALEQARAFARAERDKGT